MKPSFLTLSLTYLLLTVGAYAQPLLTETLESPQASPEAIIAPAEHTQHTTNSVAQLISKIVLFLALLGGAGYLLVKFSQGKSFFQLPSLSQFKKDSALKILETKMLGHKQFLIVVEYEDQKMLLGISPGSMQHLCQLNNPRGQS